MKKGLFLIILLLSATICSAQIVINAAKGNKKDTSRTVNSNKDKKELPTLKQTQFLQENNLIRSATDIPYVTDFQKATIKEIISRGEKTDKELLDDNMQSILSDVRKASEDKRSAVLKVVQSALAVAQEAVVMALVVREIVRDKNNTP